ncbi:glycosyltransferase family 39 protein [Actinosynnema sp. NPDC023587]|uniref:ArnT family glycosyltransferase n=1 Tax=Actinosynnema sp. NPDC023587 TaxID=3154695 RepID=UPI0034086193
MTAPPVARAPAVAAEPVAWVPVVAVAVVLGAVLALGAGVFPLGGDELYFLVAGRHPAWGYVDQPPLTPLLARLMDSLFPGSPAGLRLPVTLLTPGAAVVAALTARELGGGARAQTLTAAVFATCPILLGNSHRLITDSVDLPLWVVITWLLARWVRLRADRLWPVMGAVTGLAVQNKYLVLAFWAVALVALAVVGPRAVFRRRWPWLGGLVAAVALLPGLWWQSRHGWPQWEMGSVIAAEVAETGGRLLLGPLVLVAAGLVGSALAVSGAWWLTRSADHRFLGWAVVGLAAVVLVAGLRRDYLIGVLPLCWAMAAVQVERGTTARWWRWVPTWPALALSVLVLLRGIVPIEGEWAGGVDRYLLPMPDHRDWSGLAVAVSEVHRGLSPAERDGAVVVAGDYWRASALAVFGPAHDLPPVYGDMRGSWDFGPPPEDARTVIYVGAVPHELAERCGALRPAGEHVDRVTPAVVGDVPPTPLAVCSARTGTWAELWPRLRHLELRAPGPRGTR